MDRCLEKKIYDRQIKKQGMSDRVVDECNPDAHLSLKDVTNLCHDYDDDHKPITDEEHFKTPVDTYLDEVMKKVIINYKGCLSKEPFYHDSLLIDRKEKKLSQAEKRQAHRGYEMEKKASVRQTIAYTTNNKMQYRIVRNESGTITRPVASIRPIQNSKTQQNSTRNSGLRSTRWIPAEVWQRQGMTAQEMTLPLDVVIPTNSSDKSNIILKAGQRVMVLKSAKGIYMQLDSGKIIAIRTSSKAADTSTNNNNNKSSSSSTSTTNTTTTSENKNSEVIDITADGDNASNQTTTSSISSNSNSNSCSSISNQSKINNNNSTITKITANNNNNNANTLDIKPTTITNSLFNNNISSSTTTTTSNKATTDNIIKDINNGMNIQNNIAQQQPQQKTTQRRKPAQKIEITSNERLPPIKAFNPSQFMTTPIATKTTTNATDNLYDNEQKMNNKKSQQPQPQSNITINNNNNNDNLSNAQQQKQKMHQQNAAYGNLNVNNTQKQQQSHQATTTKVTSNYTDYAQQPHMYGSKKNENSQTNYVQPTQPAPPLPPPPPSSHQPQSSPTSLPAHKNDITGNSFEIHNKNQNITYAHTEPHQQQQQQQQQLQPLTPAVSPKNKHKNMTTECFQNQNLYQQSKSNVDNNVHDISKPSSVNNTIPAAKLTTNEYLQQQPPTQPQQQTAPLPAYTQYASAAQQQEQQQTSKMRLYMPQYGVPPHYANALPPPVTIAAPAVAPTSTAASTAPPQTILPNTYPKGVPNYSQYYESIYDCGPNMTGIDYGGAPPPSAHPPPPTTAGFADYPAYSHHTPYHTNYQTNAYGCASLSTPVRTTPYMHWSPLVTSGTLAEHYANDAAAAAAAAQANQWHHQ